MVEARPPPRGQGGGLDRRLADLRTRHPNAAPEVVADIVSAVLSAVAGDLTARGASLLGELDGIGFAIAQVRREISALEVHEINGRHIPSATDQLDAIVIHTAEATNAILDTCETLDDVAMELDGRLAGQLQSATSRIYEACSFQDIVGQRVSKVVATLKMIDAKVAALSAAVGAPQRHEPTAKEPPRAPTAADVMASLLNGPQLAADAMRQSEIDRLLAGFD